MGLDTLLYLKQIKTDDQRGPTVQHRELCSGVCGSWTGGELGGEWTQLHERPGPSCSPETVTLLVGCTPIQNKK